MGMNLQGKLYIYLVTEIHFKWFISHKMAFIFKLATFHNQLLIYDDFSANRKFLVFY